MGWLERITGDAIDAKRLDFIIRLLHLNKPAEVIVAALERRASWGKQAQERGYLTEIRVGRILSSLPCVRQVKIYGLPWQGQNFDGWVSFNRDELEKTLKQPLWVESRLPVEVKSSSEGIREFYYKYGATPQAAQTELTRLGIIVLNGQTPTNEIIASFLTQVSQINTCRLQNSRPRS